MALTKKQHDRRPYFVGQIQDAKGRGVDHAAATSLVLLVRLDDGDAPLRVALEKLTTQPPIPLFWDPETELEPVTDLLGWVRRKWQPGELDVVGTYKAEVEAIWPPDNEPETFPTVGYYTVVVADDLDLVQP